jgi:DNA-binding beta-propeller fold protein YncE
LVRTIQVPGIALGCSLTADGRLLLVANDGQGAAVLNVARAESGGPDPVLGTLSPPAGAHLHASGAIETASSADGRYVFVSLEYGPSGGVVAVYDLGSSSAPRFGPSDYKGAIRLGDAVVGSALAPSGRYLYVTSEIASQAGTSPSAIHSNGTLSVINVAIAEHNPAHAVLRTVPALSQPVRVAVSPDGSVIWVTARGSNRLLAFSIAKLLSDPTRSRLANVSVGTSPVGVAVFGDGGRVIVANSDRFNQKGAHASLTVVNGEAALDHKPAVIATLTAGQFPREMAVERGGTVVLVTNFASDQLEAVDVSHLR